MQAEEATDTASEAHVSTPARSTDVSTLPPLFIVNGCTESVTAAGKYLTFTDFMGTESCKR